MVNLVCAFKLRPDNYVCYCSLLAQFPEVLELVHIPQSWGFDVWFAESVLVLRNFYTDYLQLLEQFGFISSRDTVELKGRVACEIHSHEVLLTELLFQNVFSEYTPAEIAALLSCLVFQQVSFSSDIEFLVLKPPNVILLLYNYDVVTRWQYCCTRNQYTPI